jgi:hypothetical protein
MHTHVPIIIPLSQAMCAPQVILMPTVRTTISTTVVRMPMTTMVMLASMLARVKAEARAA